MDTEFTAVIGLDWADTKHDICIQPANSTEREFQRIEHNPAQIERWALSMHERFGGPIAVVLELANCDETYSGPLLGYWSANCDDGTTWPDGDESTIGAAKLEKAQEYIGDHLGEVPKVVAARVGRLLGLYRPLQGVDLDVFFERRVRSHVNAGLVTHYALLLTAVPGVVLWRRRTTILPLAAVAGTSIFTGAITFGIARYRIGADLVLVMLGAVVLGHLLDRYGPPATRPVATEAEPRQPVDEPAPDPAPAPEVAPA